VAGAAAMFSGRLNQMLETQISPEGLRQSFADSKTGSDVKKSFGDVTDPAVTFDLYYETFDRFAINARKDGQVRAVYLLTRDGLVGWKLSAVRLPH
jgi:hypothetical protein